MSDVNFTYEELMLAIDESLTLAKQKTDLGKFDAELNKAVNDYLERLGMKPHFAAVDELGIDID